MFHRRGQRILRRMGNPEIPPMLQRANQMLANGDYLGAADAYTQIAQGAELRFPRRAPVLFMEAGRAAILGGQVKTGVENIRRGLTLLISQGHTIRAQAFGRRAMAELRARNLNAEADEIAALIGADVQQEPPQPAAAKKPILPTHCPSCGGAVRPDEVEWLDEITAECSYCGSPVREDD